MNKITKQVIDKLSQPQAIQVLSLYIPTHRQPAPPHLQEDQTRFKNSLRAAENLLSENGISDKKIRDNLKHLEKKLNDHSFWQNTLEGLAIFISSDEVQIYHSPIEFEESITCSNTFDITPLHMMLSQNHKFHVLALAMHESKLFMGDAYGLQQMDIELPKSPEDALNIDELFSNSRTKRSHQGGPVIGMGVTSPHGEGDSSAAGSHERLQYFRIIEQRLIDYKKFDQNAPLLIAATESEAGNFKSVTHLPYVIERYLPGNYTEHSPHELFAASWPIVRSEIIHKKEGAMVDRLNEYKGARRASTKISDIEKAAEEGRIETLLVNFIEDTNDSVSDKKQGPAPVIRTMAHANKEHLKKLVESVYRQGGRIIGLDQSHMPDGAVAAALYRY